MRLFEAWADTVGLAMSAIGPEMPLERCSIDASCEMVILSVGSASVQDRQQEIWIKSVRTLLPEALLVIISDLEEPKEVCAAFEAGAAGFMPTSLDPAVALKALSVIRSGGYFFPRSALSHIHFTPEMPVEGTPAVDQLNGLMSSRMSQWKIITGAYRQAEGGIQVPTPWTDEQADCTSTWHIGSHR